MRDSEPFLQIDDIRRFPSLRKKSKWPRKIFKEQSDGGWPVVRKTVVKINSAPLWFNLKLTYGFLTRFMFHRIGVGSKFSVFPTMKKKKEKTLTLTSVFSTFLHIFGWMPGKSWKATKRSTKDGLRACSQLVRHLECYIQWINSEL